MFFNLDKNSKQNLLNEYKQEAQNYYQKKKEEKQRRIQEEREYLAQREQLEKEADEKIYREKMQRKNAQMEEYQTMLMKTKSNIPGYRHNSNKNKNDVVLNNWGGQEKSYQTIPRPQIQPQPQEQINNQNFQNSIIPQEKQETPWRGRRGGYKNEDHMGNLLNDNRNDQELNNYIKEQNDYKQKLYKDLLYSQYEEANNKNLNLYGTNDPLILERKRKAYLSENPYAKKNNYEFGKSNLTHNPITDPQNNMDYNKYLRFSESNRNINNRNNNYQMNNYQKESNTYEQNTGNLNYNNNISNNNNYNNPNNINYNNANNNNAINNNNYNNNYSNMQPLEEFKSNNYDTSNMNSGNFNNNNNNYNQNVFNGNNYNANLNNEVNQMGQNQNNGYVNNSFRPTPSGERIRQAAASNFF
jgi:hypothetical protein